MTGKSIAHYEILEKLGEGGMGVVYKARDAHLGRFVAIKILPPGKVTNTDRKARFVQEARSASALNHPNIITIHDIAEENDVDFIAMEFVAGRALDRMIPRGGMPPLYGHVHGWRGGSSGWGPPGAVGGRCRSVDALPVFVCVVLAATL